MPDKNTSSSAPTIGDFHARATYLVDVHCLPNAATGVIAATLAAVSYCDYTSELPSGHSVHDATALRRRSTREALLYLQRSAQIVSRDHMPLDFDILCAVDPLKLFGKYRLHGSQISDPEALNTNLLQALKLVASIDVRPDFEDRLVPDLSAVGFPLLLCWSEITGSRPGPWSGSERCGPPEPGTPAGFLVDALAAADWSFRLGDIDAAYGAMRAKVDRKIRKDRIAES